MLPISLTNFPYPILHQNEFYDGVIYEWPSRCRSCEDGTCSKQDIGIGSYYTCPYGYDLLRISDDATIGGIIIKDRSFSHPARNKKLRKSSNFKNIIDQNKLNKYLDNYHHYSSIERRVIDTNRDAIIDKYVKDNKYKDDYLELVKPIINKSFSSLHDYRQFATQIIQNINVLIEKQPTNSKRNNSSFDEKLEASPDQYRAIYYAARLMEEKLKVNELINNPSLIDMKSKAKRFELHPLVLKMVRIYRESFKKKDIKYNIGRTTAALLGNPEAYSIIPHAILDNAFKYAPNHSEVDIDFSDTGATVCLKIGSYGPYINTDEYQQIFDPFYRGRNAANRRIDGMGFGLFAAQFVAKRVGSTITFQQDQSDKNTANTYYTRFECKLTKAL